MISKHAEQVSNKFVHILALLASLLMVSALFVGYIILLILQILYTPINWLIMQVNNWLQETTGVA